MNFHVFSDFTSSFKRIPQAALISYLVLSRLLILFMLNNFLYPDISFVKFISLFARRWDGNSYTFIAENWYTTEGVEKAFIVFPPLYPAIVKIFSIFPGSHIYVAFAISNLFFILGSLLFYKLLIIDYSKKFALYTIILLSLFPTSYFFSAAYPESFLLFLFSGSFLLARKQNYIGASILSGLATLTRPFGVSLWPALFIEWLLFSKRKIFDLLYMIVSAVVFVSFYLGLNLVLFNNPFAFQDFLYSVWQKTYSHFWKGIWESWKRGLYSKEWDSYKLLVGYGEAIASTFTWASIPLSYFLKIKIHTSYLIYIVVGALLFSSTGFILSAPRYILSLPPLFIILAKLTDYKYLRIPTIVISTILLFASAILFTQGRWAF